MKGYGICPNCGSKLVKRYGRKRPFLGCTAFPKCRFSMDYKPENIIFDWSHVDKCPNCGGKLVKRQGKFGEFLGCSNFPKCRFSMDYDERDVKDDLKTYEWKSELISFQDEKYQSKVKLAKEFVFSNMNMSTKELLELKKWDEDVSLCMNILDDHVTVENKKYVESVLGYAHHRRDKRTSLEYACDLIVGWTIEDCIVEILNDMGYVTSLNGADKARKLLLDPTSDSDLKVSINEKEILIEQVNDFTGYWKRTEHVPLRDRKFIHLRNENSLLFGIDFKNKLFFIIDVSQTESNYIPYHKPFSKPAYALKITKNDFHDLNQVENVFSKLLSKF